ncbi:MAG: epoxyqueuosine reductase [Thermovirgaceae bacterium]|nr:epoxyqueuosine reductase [Thermovirgaceae bacterium]
MNGLTAELERVILSFGGSKCGISDVRDIPERPSPELPFAVTVALALTPEIIAGIGKGPTREYHDEYERANRKLAEIGKAALSFLEERGFRAELLGPTTESFDRETLSVPFPHKTAAIRAGIGWIGKSDLLVTKEFGSAFRMCTILTDAPVSAGEPVTESSCGSCTCCVDACPVGAPTGREWRRGSSREDLVDIFACYRRAKEFARDSGWNHSICGICIEACPWTKKYIKSRSES